MRGDNAFMPIGKEDQFVELNRRFRKLEQNVRAEDVAVDSYTSGFSWQMGSVNWDDLLKENRVVVLGEPGSGKSWEMKERARLLNSQGASAFYVRLDQLLER
jgi:Cdc6-like AAA superfamily ATPase